MRFADVPVKEFIAPEPLALKEYRADKQPSFLKVLAYTFEELFIICFIYPYAVLFEKKDLLKHIFKESTKIHRTYLILLQKAILKNVVFSSEDIHEMIHDKEYKFSFPDYLDLINHPNISLKDCGFLLKNPSLKLLEYSLSENSKNLEILRWLRDNGDENDANFYFFRIAGMYSHVLLEKLTVEDIEPLFARYEPEGENRIAWIMFVEKLITRNFSEEITSYVLGSIKANPYFRYQALRNLSVNKESVYYQMPDEWILRAHGISWNEFLKWNKYEVTYAYTP